MAISRKSNNETHSSRVAHHSAIAARPIKVGLLSSGLGRINRGFEVTTSRWYESIKDVPDVSAKVYAGGDYPGAVRGWNLERDVLLNSPLRVFGKANERAFWEFCFTVEQVTFSMCLPDLLFWRPDVVWTKEVPLAHFLLAYKYMFGLRYKIIFANGGAFRPETYKWFDYIQHLHPDSFAEAESIGIPTAKMQVLPNCVFYAKPLQSREELRAKYGFAQSDWIVICVAAWNSFQKRLDYLIEEVARIDDPDVKLLLCGQPELETAALKELAEQKLGDRVRWMTLLPDEVHDVLAMSDVFALASFREGLASSIIEAAMAGLPIVSHPHSGGRFILKDDFWMNDMSQPGTLTARLEEIRANGVPYARLVELQKSADARFSKGALAHQFVDMIKHVAQM
jgi:glycosyltransferase involved in cell wall biosynthesis